MPSPAPGAGDSAKNKAGTVLCGAYWQGRGWETQTEQVVSRMSVMRRAAQGSGGTWRCPWEDPRRPLREATFNPGFRGRRPQLPEYHKTRVHKADSCPP